MTFGELKGFLERRMKQSHVYQPVLIRALVDGAVLRLPALRA